LIKLITHNQLDKVLNRGIRFLKGTFLLGIAIIFVLASPYFFQFFPLTVSNETGSFYSSAQTSPTGTCFPNGPAVVSNSTVWENLQCIHVGSISINGTGSLTMINSSLVQEVVNATPSDVILSSFSQMNLVSSTLNLGGIGVLEITANSSVSLDTSGVVNASVVLSNVGKLSANSTSYLNLNGLNSTSLGSMVFTNSVINIAPQEFTFLTGTTTVPVNELAVVFVSGNSTLELNGATFQASNSSTVLLNTLHALILNSHVTNMNITDFALGNSTLSGAQTTIENSEVVSALTGNATIGSPAALSTTEIFSSVVSISNSLSQNVGIYGTAALTVFNSTVSAQVGSTIKAFGTLLLYGGIVSILRSSISSSTFDYYGYSSIAASNLIINSTLYFNIISSQLLSGQSSQRGLYSVSHLILNSGANMTIAGTQIKSEALTNNSIVLRSSSPANIIHNMTVTQTAILAGPNPSNITFSSGYGLLFNRTIITTSPNSTINVNAYQLTSYDSLVPANITVGSTVAFAYLYNTTVNSVVGLKTGIYQNYAWLLVHVLNNGSTQSSVPGATVALLDPVTGSLAYTAQTNSSGWAKISVLQAETNSSASVNRTYYIVQAESGNSLSNQEYVTTNNTSVVNLLLNPNTGGFANLNYFSYALQYEVGIPVSFLGIYTNAYPLNFINNASFSELDFNTVGAIGRNYTFALTYPANFTTAPLTISVDQIPLKDVKITSNSTYYFVTFSMPSGFHRVSLSYVSPNSNYIYQQNPILNPSVSVIAAVILLLVVGTVFIFYYARRQNSFSKST